jgi:hypothetical protein
MLLERLRRHDPDRPDVGRLWKQLAADESATKVAAREALVAAGAAAVPTLVDVLRGPDHPLTGNTSWHSKARYVLGLIPAADVVPALLALSEDRDPGRRTVAADLLCHQAARDPASARAIAAANPDLVGRLVQRLATEKHPAWVVRALLNTGAPGAVEASLEELTHVAGHARFLGVALAIAECGDERTDPYVEAALVRGSHLMRLDLDAARLSPGPAPLELVRTLNETATSLGCDLIVAPGTALSQDGDDLVLRVGGDRLLLRAGPPKRLDESYGLAEMPTLDVVLADDSQRLEEVRRAMRTRRPR